MRIRVYAAYMLLCAHVMEKVSPSKWRLNSFKNYLLFSVHQIVFEFFAKCKQQRQVCPTQLYTFSRRSLSLCLIHSIANGRHLRDRWIWRCLFTDKHKSEIHPEGERQREWIGEAGREVESRASRNAWNIIQIIAKIFREKTSGCHRKTAIKHNNK